MGKCSNQPPAAERQELSEPTDPERNLSASVKGKKNKKLRNRQFHIYIHTHLFFNLQNMHAALDGQPHWIVYSPSVGHYVKTTATTATMEWTCSVQHDMVSREGARLCSRLVLSPPLIAAQFAMVSPDMASVQSRPPRCNFTTWQGAGRQTQSPVTHFIFDKFVLIYFQQKGFKWGLSFWRDSYSEEHCHKSADYLIQVEWKEAFYLFFLQAWYHP